MEHGKSLLVISDFKDKKKEEFSQYLMPGSRYEFMGYLNIRATGKVVDASGTEQTIPVFGCRSSCSFKQHQLMEQIQH